MKVFLILFVCHICLLNTTAQTKPLKEVWINEHLYKVYPTYCNYGLPSFTIVLHDSPPPGSYVLYFKKDHSKIAALFNVGQNKSLDGEITEFYISGKVSLISHYYQGVDTFWTEYYKNGVHMNEGHQKIRNKDIADENWPGIIVGKQKWWYENGNLKSINDYDLDGHENGIQVSWFKNGQKNHECYFKHGLKDSFETFWYDNGQILKQVKYKSGVFINQEKAVYYYPNGKPAFIGALVNNCEVGQWKAFYDNGGKKWEGSIDTVIYCFADDCRPGPMSTKFGTWTYYYADGKIMAKGSYKLWAPWNETYTETKMNDWMYFDKEGNAIKAELLKQADHEMVDSIFMETFSSTL